MRYTIKALRLDLEKYNASLAKYGHTYSLKAEARNGYTGLDLYEGDKCLRNLECGTPRECLNGARDFIIDAQWSY